MRRGGGLSCSPKLGMSCSLFCITGGHQRLANGVAAIAKGKTIKIVRYISKIEMSYMNSWFLSNFKFSNSIS